MGRELIKDGMPYNPPSAAAIFSRGVNLCGLEFGHNSERTPDPIWTLATHQLQVAFLTIQKFQIINKQISVLQNSVGQILQETGGWFFFGGGGQVSEMGEGRGAVESISGSIYKHTLPLCWEDSTFP